MAIFSKIKERLPKVYSAVSSLFSKGILEPVKKRFGRKTLKAIPNEHRDELEASLEAYNPKDERKQTITGGYQYDKSISTKRTAVYVKDGGAHVLLAIRGTVPTQVRDLLSDGKIFLEDFKISKDKFKQSRFMKEANKAFKKVKETYGNDTDITITGHSLGGRGAIQLAKEKDEDAVAFNAGGGDFGTSQINAKSTHYRAPKDPISVGFATDPRTITIDKNKPGINHSLEYFK